KGSEPEREVEIALHAIRRLGNRRALDVAVVGGGPIAAIAPQPDHAPIRLDAEPFESQLRPEAAEQRELGEVLRHLLAVLVEQRDAIGHQADAAVAIDVEVVLDRKSTRLNSSH